MATIDAPADIRFPVITALLLVAAVVIYGIADSNHWFIYDRNRVLDGELWRIGTGHLVHFSWEHLAFNLGVFVLTGCFLEHRLGIWYGWLLALSALASGLYFLLFLPDMAQYGGLSGLVTANVVCLSLLEIQHNKKTRLFWTAILLLVVAKIAYEILVKATIFVSTVDARFEVVPSAHLIGAVVAIACFTGLNTLKRG